MSVASANSSRSPASGSVRTFHPAADDAPDLVDVDGLGDVVEGAELHGRDRGLDGGVGGHHDDSGLGAQTLDAFERLDAVHARHAQVHDDEIVEAGAEPLHGRRAVGGGVDLVAVALEDRSQEFQHAGLVVDDEYVEWP